MEVNDSVRTRLTHSHEVSNLARSIGVQLAFTYGEKVFGSERAELQVERVVPSMLAAVALAHDLGNPPFGHQGEVAMQQWFRDGNAGKAVAVDFKKFDGNAQTFRLVTRLQVLSDDFGLNLTYGTLAALLKYPSVYGARDKGGFKKYGVFRSEADIAEEVWHETGLRHGTRHPLAYVVEACDDIAYSVIDAEDTVKKGYASFYDLMDYLDSWDKKDKVIRSLVDTARQKNADFKTENLSSRELNDVSMQIFRVNAIAAMIPAAVEVFVANSAKLIEGDAPKGFELIGASRCAALCEAAKEFDFRHGYRHKDVLRLELAGSNYIKSTMDMLWSAISHDGDQPFERFAYGEISENYRRVFEKASGSVTYKRCQLLCDAVSGMTESYLVKKHDELRALANASTEASSG
jgi:dGTPase